MLELYRAFVGPAKAGYYVPIFERFDNGAGATSWNWAAALVTQIWMIFRGMFLWGLLWYWLLYIAAYAVIAVGLSLVGGGSAAAFASLVVMLISFGVMGLYSNKLYHNHARRLIDQSGRLGLSEQERREWLIRKGSGNGVFVIVVILAIVALIGILAAIAVPAYQDYVIRSKVAQVLLTIEDAKPAYLNYTSRTNQWPTSMADLGLRESSPDYGSGVESVTIGAEHELRITFSDGAIAGQTIILVPSVVGQTLEWTCSVETLPAKYAPAACRH